MRRMASAGRRSSASVMSTKSRRPRLRHPVRFVVCIENSGYPVSLELHKIYRAVPDQDATREGDLRIVDESGEDYLYPAEWFAAVVHGLPPPRDQHWLFLRHSPGEASSRVRPSWPSWRRPSWRRRHRLVGRPPAALDQSGRWTRCMSTPPSALGCGNPMSARREPGRPRVSIIGSPAAAMDPRSASMSGDLTATWCSPRPWEATKRAIAP